MTPTTALLFLALSLPLSAAPLIPFSPPSAISSAPLGAGDPSVASNGNLALVTWRVAPGGHGSIFGSLIDADGNVHPPITIYESGQDAAGNPLSLSADARAIGTNDGFLIVLYESSSRAKLLTRFVGHDGALGEWQQLTAAACDIPRRATNGDRVLVMTSCDGASSFLLDTHGNVLQRLQLDARREYTVTATDHDFIAFTAAFFYTPQESHTDILMRISPSTAAPAIGAPSRRPTSSATSRRHSTARTSSRSGQRQTASTS